MNYSLLYFKVMHPIIIFVLIALLWEVVRRFVISRFEPSVSHSRRTSSESILAVLVCSSANVASKMTTRLFVEASIPSRLYVVVCAPGLRGETSVAADIDRLFHKAGLNTLKQNVEILECGLDNHETLRSRAERTLKGQKFVLHVDCACTPLHHWDVALLSELRTINNGVRILSTSPDGITSHRPYPLARFPKLKRRRSHADIEYIPLKSRINRPPSVFAATYDMLFADASFFTQVRVDAAMQSRHDADLRLSAQIFNKKFTVRAPELCPFVMGVRAARVVVDKQNEVTSKRKYAMNAFWEHCGYNAETGDLKKRAALGLTSDACVWEKISKYGSSAEVERLYSEI